MDMTLFDTIFEEQAIERIKKFSQLSEKLGFVPELGFSGGKDSIVCYDLCKRANIKFHAVFNHCFESHITLQFIRKYYPEVEWRREVKQGFFENARQHGFLPTVEKSYCCKDYKHNPKYATGATIVGVRRAESQKRRNRQTFSAKTKTMLKKNKELISEYFSEHCTASGSPSEIQLCPIIDWTDAEVWSYCSRHNLPINPEYADRDRVGCIICPKASFSGNYKSLLKYPKLIDCVIKAREKSGRDIDWNITNDNKDYADNKAMYVCRYLNHSFRKFSRKQELLARMVVDNYR